MSKDGVLCLLAGTDDHRGIISNGRVRWWMSGEREGSTQSGRVQYSQLNDANEVMVALPIIVDLEEELVKDLAESGEFFVSWLIGDAQKSGRCGGKQGYDTIFTSCLAMPDHA